MNKIFTGAFALLSILFFNGCFSGSQISSENLSSIYHQGEHLFHPEFTVYDFTTDSSHLFIRLNTDEFVKIRSEDNSFKGHLR